ncbi:hypothetical protein BOX15_Mlig008415g2 [Macrostomum lignano]|uniref:Uncharacterized protein n=2 Tax=Macrostomum lignano TaxID=282301 RepID=A0A267ESI0_9PLAT|nr:hypothetical protein BOX15_Mlig008415g1 [Macrostomum lignano]PAA80565.1 hypothetical protein BOX15_Mlig008415g2 [Macrostomum lignano]
MISDIVIAITLFANACAILNFKLRSAKDTHRGAEFFFEPAPASSTVLGDKTREFLTSLRYFRVFIGMWNIFVILLMLTMFSS